MYLQKINLKNKYALVTGAGKGLGRACSIALAEAGATVIALSRTSSDLNKLEKDIKKVKGKIIKVSCDVMNYEDLKQKLEKIKIIDGGKTKIGLESTVVDLTKKIRILRPGIISQEKIQKILKRKIYNPKKVLTNREKYVIDKKLDIFERIYIKT